MLNSWRNLLTLEEWRGGKNWGKERYKKNDAGSKAMFENEYIDTMFGLPDADKNTCMLAKTRLDGFKERMVVEPFLEIVLWKLRMKKLPFFLHSLIWLKKQRKNTWTW